ncbi:MAG: hypothetical protein ACK4JB_12060 [Reyranella sp.]
MRIKYILALLAIGCAPVAHAQDAGPSGPATGRVIAKEQDASVGGGRRAKQKARAEQASCAISVAPHVLLQPGQQVRLTWTAQNATSARIEGIGSVPLEPSRQAVVDRPERTKTYEMEVAGPNGTATCRVSVAVPQRVEPLHWPPAALAGMPADYLIRVRESLATSITRARLVNDHRWVGYAISSLLFEQDVDRVNQYLASHWEAPQHDRFGFGLFSMDAVRLYGLFNDRSGVFGGRLTAAAQRRMEEQLYRISSQTRFNDYRFASNLANVWTMKGSENHAFAAQSSFLLVSQFLKNSPDLAKRAYEDGRTPAEHYEAWRRYWSKLLDERAKRGIYVEIASPTYEDETRQAIQNIRDFAEDPVLRQKAEMLLDVTYALIAQDSLGNGARGGAKSRVYTFKDDKFRLGGRDVNYNLIFGTAGYAPGGSDQATSTYFPPSAVLKLGRETAARGTYEIVTRVPGVGKRKDKETQLDPDRSVLRYGFVTPSYVLGSFVLDPAVSYAPTSSQNRWQGVVFDGDFGALVAPRVVSLTRAGEVDAEQRAHDAFASLQDRNILIMQQSKTKGRRNMRTDLYLPSSLDALEEEDGWIFIREGKSFAAIRIVAQQSNPYTWLDAADEKKSETRQKQGRNRDAAASTAVGNNDKKKREFVTLRNAGSPIIFAINQATDFGNDFARFKAAMKQQKIEHDGQTLRFAGLVFYGSERIGSRHGEVVDVSPPRLYDSPFIRSDWDSGRIFIRFGDEALSLDFSDTDKPSKARVTQITPAFPPGIGTTEPVVFGAR